MAAATCPEKLAEARDALHSLLTGTKEVSVQYGERRITYNNVNRAELVAYVAQLEAECGDASNKDAARRRPFGVVW